MSNKQKRVYFEARPIGYASSSAAMKNNLVRLTFVFVFLPAGEDRAREVPQPNFKRFYDVSSSEPFELLC